MVDAETEEVLRAAGWTEGRSVPELVAAWERELATKGFEMHPPARRFLREFGGLAWPPRHPGEHLEAFAFNIDPAVAAFENDRFAEAESATGRCLYPVGEAVNGHMFLAISDQGEFYALMDTIEPALTDPWALFSQLLRAR